MTLFDAKNSTTRRVQNCWSALLGPRASRPQHAEGAVFGKSFPKSFSHFALTAGGTPAVPVKSLSASSLLLDPHKKIDLEIAPRIGTSANDMERASQVSSTGVAPCSPNNILAIR